jgi:hypothetical protein
MLLELRSEEVTNEVMPWYERSAERAAAKVLSSERTMRLVTGALRVLQTPLKRGNSMWVPALLNPAKGRKLPSLARKSFRDMWKDGEVQ